MAVTIVTMPFQKVPKNADIVWIKRLVATDIVSDGTRAMLASSDLTACGYIDNQSMAEHLMRFMEMLIDTADEELNKKQADTKEAKELRETKDTVVGE